MTHNTADFTAAMVSDCHTMAHAPQPPSARLMPTNALAIKAMTLATAIMRTSIRFIRRLTCTIEVE